MGDDCFYAHSLPGERDPAKWQLLEDHLRNTAEKAKQFATPFRSGDWAYLAGLWHDIGKYSKEFQNRICSTGDLDAHIETIGKVDHSTAGAKHANDALPNHRLGKAIAYLIAGHHGGLPDGISTDSCLRSRLDKVIPSYDGCPSKILQPVQLSLPFSIHPDKAGIRISLFIRMLYSCLVDADFLDTEAFMDLQRSVSRRGYPSLMDLSDIFFSRLAAKRELSTPSQVNRRRNYVLDQCMRGAEHNMGLFSLTVPTGGGKTLSSMAFAIRHAIRHGLKRIIYVIPFTSIIEQNAAVFRDFLGEGAVLEHHSNFEPKDEDYRSRLAAENWDAPVVVTTNVQFFESLFSNRSSRCRKLHNIAESVIILDEVQTLPAPFLLPCLETIQELVSSYRTSFMLCSATQPAVQERSDFRHGLKNITEIIENPAELSMSMKRTMTKVLPQTKDSDLAVQLAQQDQVLCIVNTRKHASQIYGIMKGTEGLYHLSALMCPVHRSHVLNQIRDRLAKSQPCRVVSTQLIEAGVDIDFPVVYRAMAGIDSIAQAAGRCNREGKKEFGQVFVFTPESGIPAGHFRQTAQAAESVTRRFSDDILSLSAIEEYFKMYYWQKGDALDKEEILAMLQAGCGKGDFPFKTIAEKFQFIKDSMKPVIIPFDDQARKLIQLLEHHDNPAFLTRTMQKYAVSIPPRQWDNLFTLGSIVIKADLFPVLVDEGLYKPDLGLCVDDPTQREPEELFA